MATPGAPVRPSARPRRWIRAPAPPPGHRRAGMSCSRNWSGRMCATVAARPQAPCSAPATIKVVAPRRTTSLWAARPAHGGGQVTAASRHTATQELARLGLGRRQYERAPSRRATALSHSPCWRNPATSPLMSAPPALSHILVAVQAPAKCTPAWNWTLSSREKLTVDVLEHRRPPIHAAANDSLRVPAPLRAARRRLATP